MIKCEHILIPIVYGYLYGDKINSLNNNEIIYGGTHKKSDSPDWFCKICLEDVYI